MYRLVLSQAGLLLQWMGIDQDSASGRILAAGLSNRAPKAEEGTLMAYPPR